MNPRLRAHSWEPPKHPKPRVWQRGSGCAWNKTASAHQAPSSAFARPLPSTLNPISPKPSGGPDAPYAIDPSPSKNCVPGELLKELESRFGVCPGLSHKRGFAEASPLEGGVKV